MAIFSHRHAAVRAGLGEFGLNNLVITRQFGPRVRFVSIITDATLEPTPLLERKVCLGVEECSLCIDECSPMALALNPKIDHNKVWLNPVSRTDMAICRERRDTIFCYGRCIRVCPVGLPSPFHIHNSSQSVSMKVSMCIVPQNSRIINKVLRVFILALSIRNFKWLPHQQCYFHIFHSSYYRITGDRRDQTRELGKCIEYGNKGSTEDPHRARERRGVSTDWGLIDT